MTVRIAPAPAWPGARALAVILTTTMLAIAVGSSAFAQTPPGPAPAPKGQTKPPPSKPTTPPAPPAPGDAQAQPGATAQPQLLYSPWTKGCMKGPEANVCFTGKEGYIESGMLVIAAALIQQDGGPKRILRITLPLGMQLAPGTRATIDQGQPMNAPYGICIPIGCIAEYEASDELIGKMKKGQGLLVQGVNGQGQVVGLALPLAEFAKAFDGPPTELAELEKMQKDMQKKLEDRRKKWESQQPAAPQH